MKKKDSVNCLHGELFVQNKIFRFFFQCTGKHFFDIALILLNFKITFKVLNLKIYFDTISMYQRYRDIRLVL